MFVVIVEDGVPCATIISTILMLKLCVANLDIPLYSSLPTVAHTTDQETGESGWTTLAVLGLNHDCHIVIMRAGELTTVHTVKMSELLVVSRLKS